MAEGIVVADAANTLDTAITIIGFVATIASLVLAIGAIWLSVIFYKMSNEASKETTKAAKDIQASVDRLEKIFDKLYSDTFSMMRDTVTDMRQHIWKKPQTEGSGDIISNEEKINEIKDSITQELIHSFEEKLKSNGDNETKIKDLEEKIKKIFESGIQKTITSQSTPKSALRRKTLSFIRRFERIRLSQLLTRIKISFIDDEPFSENDVMSLLFELREKNLISWDGPADRLSLDDVIFYVAGSESFFIDK